MNEFLRVLRSIHPRRLRRIYQFFAPYLKEQRKYIIGALIASIASVTFLVLQPWPLKFVFDYVLYHKRKHAELLPFFDLISTDKQEGMLIICGMVLVIAVCRGVAEYYVALLTNYGGQRLVFSLRSSLYDQLQRLSLKFHHSSSSGDLLMRLTGDILLLREMLVSALITGLSDVLILVVIISLMIYLDPFLTILAISILPLLAITTYYFGGQLRVASRRQRRKEGQVATMGHEMLLGIRVVQAFNREKVQRKRFEQQNRSSFRQGMRAVRLEAKLTRWVEIILAVGTVLVLWFGVERVRENPPRSTPGDLLVFLAYLRFMYRPIRDFAKLANRTAKAAASGERVMEILRTDPDVCDLPGAEPAPRLAGAIEFRRVRFGYNAETDVLRGIDLRIRPGEKVAIVGLNGSGKTTLLSLICRFYDPTSGSVRLDGRDLREYTVASLRKQISPVFQESLLFGTTAFENIAFGRPDATLDEVQRAALQAQADEFISGFPRGYNTVIAERGMSISEGQKQRIALARAFLKKAPILLLDEPTSNVDVRSERKILRAVRRLMKHRTTILVTHNLRLLHWMDRIVVLDGGRIAQIGTHDELAVAPGLYARLIAMHEIVPPASLPVDEAPK